MSSARLLLAAVASGLAACAHTPSNDLSSFYMPDLRAAAPMRVTNGAAVDGLDDHIVIVVDPQAIARVNSASRSDPFAQLYYPRTVRGYRRTSTTIHPQNPTTPSQSPVTAPSVSRQAAPGAPTRNQSSRTRLRR